MKYILLTAAALVAAVVYFVLDPAQYALFPKCPFHTLTGWECPGCGSQRTIHALLHGEFRQAFFHNPLLTLSFPYLLVIVYLEYFRGKIRHPRLRRALMGRTAGIAWLVIVVLFWIGRNVIR
jgi:hypothetical protein